MAYTAIDKSSDYFVTKLWTGNDTAQTITGIPFAPDFVWIKNRSTAESHTLANTVIGANNFLKSNATSGNNTNSEFVKSFTSDGYTLGNADELNNDSNNIVGWNWKAGTSFTNDASATGIGSIDSNGSVSTTSGFSIVKWTGTGATGTIAHGLGAVPRMIIVKSLANTTTWMCQHASIGNAKEIYLNNNSAAGNSTAWNSTTPTSTVFSVTGGAGDGVNASGDYIAYCFSDVQGFLKINSYVGNGNADGTFIYTGFKPAFVMVKVDAVGPWLMWDNKRPAYNLKNLKLKPSSDVAEATDSSNDPIDFLSNGFKCRGANDDSNKAATKVIYMAFAEEPLVTSTGIPATAR